MTKPELEARIVRLRTALDDAQRELAGWGRADEPANIKVRWHLPRLEYRMVVRLPDGSERFVDLQQR